MHCLAGKPGRGRKHLIEGDRTGELKGEENAERKAKVADAVDDERLDRRRIGGRPFIPEADQQIGRSPTPSQPKNSCTRLSAVTSVSMAKVNSDR